MSMWTVDKILAGLKCFIHQENMSALSAVPEERLQTFRTVKSFDEKKLLEVLKVVFEGKEEKFDLYGTIEEIFEDLKSLDMIPELIKFSTNGVTELSDECISAIRGFRMVTIDKKGFHSKQDVTIFFYKIMMMWLGKQKTIPFAKMVYSQWLLLFIHTIREELKDCYEYVSESVWTDMNAEIENLEFKLENRSRGATAKRFFDQRFRQDVKNKSFYKHSLEILDEMMENHPSERNQEFYDHIYNFIDTVIIYTKKIHQRYIEVFTPFSESQILSQYQTTVVRLFSISGQQFILAKELEKALKLAIKRRYPNKSFPQGLVKVESEEDRKNGLVFSVSDGEFRQVLKKLDLTENDLNICTLPLFRNHLFSFLPIISSYGTHCKPAWQVFHELIYYITVVLKWFERTRGQHTQKVISWISQFDYLFTEKENRYFIETWKIEEIFNKAKREFKATSNEEHVQNLRKPLYTLPELIAVLQKLGGNIPLPLIFIFESLNILDSSDPKKTYTIKEALLCHSQAVKCYVLSEKEKVRRNDNCNSTRELKTKIANIERNYQAQVCNLKVSSDKKDQQIEALQEELKKSSKEIEDIIKVHNSLKQETSNLTAKNRELMLENCNQKKQKSSTDSETKDNQMKNLENTNKKLVEAIEKMKKENEQFKMREKIKMDEMTNLLQQFEKLNETHQKCEKSVNEVNRQLQQLKIANENKDKQITKLENKNKKLTHTIEQLEKENETMKKRENSKNDEIFDLRRELEYRRQCEYKRNKLQEKFVDERMTKYEAILRTNYETLIDTMWSNLHELTRRYPNSNDFRLAKSEVKRFDENLKNYLKIVKQDYWKMRDDPNISIDELHPEVEQFPSQEFKDKYERWVFENNLEAQNTRCLLNTSLF